MQKTNIISFSERIKTIQHVGIICKKDSIWLVGSKGCICIFLNQPLRKYFKFISRKKNDPIEITLERFKSIFISDLSQIVPYIFFDEYSDKVYEKIRRYIINSKNIQLFKCIGNPINPTNSVTITGSYIYKVV